MSYRLLERFVVHNNLEWEKATEPDLSKEEGEEESETDSRIEFR
jgi:hypothetical protein